MNSHNINTRLINHQNLWCAQWLDKVVQRRVAGVYGGKHRRPTDRRWWQ